jgi:quercetin dioxygenase-like cupin family protein
MCRQVLSFTEALLSKSVRASPQIKRTERNMTEKHTPIVNAPGTGEANGVFGFKRYFRITPEDTGGAFCVFEEEVEEGTGPPLHIHHTEHEMFTVLSGSVKFHCDGTEAVAPPGTTALIPAGARHAFKGILPGTSRVLVMLSPGARRRLLPRGRERGAVAEGWDGSGERDRCEIQRRVRRPAPRLTMRTFVALPRKGAGLPMRRRRFSLAGGRPNADCYDLQVMSPVRLGRSAMGCVLCQSEAVMNTPRGSAT